MAQTLKAAIEHEGALRSMWAAVGDFRVVALGLLDGPTALTKVTDAVKTEHGTTGCWLQVNSVPAGEDIDDGHWKGGLESGSI
ncbi:hypothetical protein [Solirubrobacter soli]|uniref:hypothetical protein n=1 Tax=Solirubrobacter soli TaxID=363832 RepID=UPI00041D145F|nr:hypothetical protein [Solirubrobacter soli]